MNPKNEANKKMDAKLHHQKHDDVKTGVGSACGPLDKAVLTRKKWILDAAYYKSEARSFKPGKELDDWLEAEKEYAEMKVDLFLSVFKEDHNALSITDLQRLAGFVGVHQPQDMRQEAELVHAIQTACLHLPCFQTNNTLCDERDCPWRAKCQNLVAVWMR